MKKTVLFLVLSAWLSGGQEAAATDHGLLFSCNFDGKVSPEFALGDKGTRCARPAVFQAGVRGQALLIGGRPSGEAARNSESPYNCYYGSEENLDVRQGSVAFWVKPLDWGGDTKGFNVLFRAGIGREVFQIYKYWSDDRLLFLRGEQEKWTSVEFKIRDWRPGQWHHVAATWSPAELRLFVDGARVCSRRVRYPMASATPVEPFSVGPGGTWEKGFIGQSLIDQLRIYGRPLGEEEVVRLYREDASELELDTGLITVGEKTPTLDGLVNDFEYAYAGSGFCDLRGFMSRHLGRYFLSYDRSNLYVAVQGDIERHRPQRVEVLLCPADSAKNMVRFALAPTGGSAQSRMVRGESGNVWTVEAAIPFSAMGLNGPPEGQRWRLNVGRILSAPEEAISAAPVVGGLDDRSHFLTIVFRSDAPSIRNAGWVDLAKNQMVSDLSVRPKSAGTEIRADFVSDSTKPYGLRTYSCPLFAGGRSTPFRSPVWPVPEFSLSEVRIAEKRDGRETMLCRIKSLGEQRTPLKTFFLYTQERKRLAVSALRGADGQIQARFLRPDGSCALAMRQAIPTDSSYFNAVFDLDLQRLAAGDYTVKIDHVAPDGKLTETWEQAYRVPGKDAPELRPYVDEEVDKVPRPWTPLVTRGNRVEMWGRAYDFSEGTLFSSLVSQGRELLAAPAELVLNGKRLAPVRPVAVAKLSANDLAAAWSKTADLGKLTVESRIRVHFDGYCELTMTLAPAGETQVASLALDIPLRREVATLVRDCKLSALGGSKSGAVGDYWCQGLLDSRWGPFLWVGNERLGFNWLAPSLEGWHTKNNTKNVELTGQGDRVVLRLNLVDSPIKLDGPRTIKFGFTLTPSRPLDRKILRMRTQKDLQMWCQPWEYFAYPDYDMADRREIERAGEESREVFLYFGDGLISPFCPEWAFWEEQWRSLRPDRTYGEWTGDFTDTKFRNRCCYLEGCIKCDSFRNFLLHQRNEFFTRAKTPLTAKATSYYFDTGVPCSCENARHGCVPWKSADGRSHNRILIDENRELALGVYRMIKRTGPSAKVWGHQGWIRVMPVQHFADILCGGEGVGGEVSRTGNYYDLLTPEMFRATFSPSIWGMKMVFLDMTVRMLSETHPDKLIGFSLNDPESRRALLHSYGYCLVHDVDIHDSYRQSRALREAIWAAQDALGWDENVLFHPYWENDAVRLAGPKSNRIMASAYTKCGKMLLAVLNDTDQEQHVRLELDLKRLVVAEGLRGHDVWEPARTYALSTRWDDRVPARGLRLVLWADAR